MRYCLTLILFVCLSSPVFAGGGIWFENPLPNPFPGPPANLVAPIPAPEPVLLIPSDDYVWRPKTVFEKWAVETIETMDSQERQALMERGWVGFDGWSGLRKVGAKP